MRNIKKLRLKLEQWIKGQQNELELHPSEIASILRNSYQEDKEQFLYYIKNIDSRFIGQIILELPEKIKAEVIEILSFTDLSEATKNLESDDATDLIQDIEIVNEDKVDRVLSLLDEDDQKEINKLLKYEEHQAGAWMQTEFFYAFLHETIFKAIDRLKELKREGELQEVHKIFIVDKEFHILGSMRVDELLIYDFNTKFNNLIDKLDNNSIKVYANDDIKIVSKIFEEYDLQVVPVVDNDNRMIGRITSDDAYDIISEIATDQVYSMAGVDDEVEDDEDIREIIKTRAYWLFINLLTAVLASMVIGLFDSTLQALIPLAILMPIVASMGGNAGTQTLTVVVRQLALGEIEKGEGVNAIKREVIISITNGVIFALAISVITYLWFNNFMLGVVIAVAMVVNLFIAGLFGSIIPITLKHFNIDPAIGSTVLLTTATDIFGFFIFLGLAKAILL